MYRIVYIKNGIPETLSVYGATCLFKTKQKAQNWINLAHMSFAPNQKFNIKVVK